MNPTYSFVAQHLWQSTVFAALAGLLTLVLRKNHARTRYTLWLIASVKFLIPFYLLFAIGGYMGARLGQSMPASSAAMDRFAMQVNGPGLTPAWVAVSANSERRAERDNRGRSEALLLALWALGCATVVRLQWKRWRRVRDIVRAASLLPFRIGDPGIEARSSAALVEPAVFGIWRPVLLLPAGVADRLSPAQFQAILAHELCHVRRRDNLAAAIHMVVEAMFWFHPLVWWLGARLVEERERACDEEVILLGSRPLDYAEGILCVCRFYLESPLCCVSGITGSDLRRRIERIMDGRTIRETRRLNLGKKLLLAVAGLAVVAQPIVTGWARAPRTTAQGVAAVPGLAFDVASVKPNKSGTRGYGFPPPLHGAFRAINAPLKALIIEAYQIQEYQLAGGPGWLDSERFDITAKGPSNTRRSEVYRMLQTLLTERFGLALHRETKEMSIYSITVDKNGPRMSKADDGECGEPTRDHPCGGFNMSNRSHLQGEHVSVGQLADMLALVMGRVVVDNSGLKNNFNIKLDWTPDDFQSRGSERPDAPVAAEGGPNVFAAMREQLGLKLESRKGPVEMLVIDRVEKPTETSVLPSVGKLLLAKAAVAAIAQPVASFEVASIRPSQPGMRGSNVNLPPPGREFTSKNVPLGTLIQVAYHIHDFQLSGGPGWMNSDPFDIAAKTEHDADREQIRRMLQALLADRFKLVVRRETKELPIYELVVAKNGPKLPEATEGDGGFRWGGSHVYGHMVSLVNFAEVLSASLGRPVVDRTRAQPSCTRSNWIGRPRTLFRAKGRA